MQTFPYTKPLSAASERECFLHVSLFRSKPLARFLLYAISSMPRFSTFHNKSLDRINCRLGRDGKALFTKAENKPQDLPHSKTHMLDANTLQISTACHALLTSLPLYLGWRGQKNTTCHETVIKEYKRVKRLQTNLVCLRLPPCPPPKSYYQLVPLTKLPSPSPTPPPTKP